MHRPLDGWLESLLGDSKYSHMTRYELFHGAMVAKGLLLDTLETEQIPYTVVNYPRVAQDREYAWNKIGRLLEVNRQVFDEAYKAVTRTDWIDWTIRNASDMPNDRSRLELETQGVDALRDAALPWTGERLVPTASGQTAVEHLHRYAVARDIASGKTVLDIASGEGYGAHLLAEVAELVIGVDITADAVRHAQTKYGRNNLAFIVGECASIPLDTATVDLVVSFETLEHHDRHEAMIMEIKRILRTDGTLIISSPDKREYSEIPNYKNPFHVLELDLSQFEALLQSHFRNVHIYGQRVSSGSYVAPIPTQSEALVSPFKTYTGNFSGIHSECGIHRPIYFIAVASNGQLPTINSGLFEGESFLLQRKEEVITSLTDQLTQVRHDNERDRIFADAVRRTLTYRLYKLFIKPFKLE
jgi:ubiquinone/menaquinone biosynthesis C-methylase UbiE